MRHYVIQVEGLTSHRIRELEYFCLQYKEKQKWIRDHYRIMRATSWGYGTRVVGGTVCDDTPELALDGALDWAERDVEMIERAATMVAKASGCGEIMQAHLLRYVTSADKPLVDSIPCGRRQFYTLRRLFFVTLHRLRVEG